jgi:hypothetical protein
VSVCALFNLMNRLVDGFGPAAVDNAQRPAGNVCPSSPTVEPAYR